MSAAGVAAFGQAADERGQQRGDEHAAEKAKTLFYVVRYLRSGDQAHGSL